jgi:hypothetical protein
MEAFFVVVVAAAILGVGVVALMVLLRLRRRMDPTDPQER